MAKTKKVVKKVVEKKAETPHVPPVDIATMDDIAALHEICLTITGRIDRIVAAITRSKTIKGM